MAGGHSHPDETNQTQQPLRSLPTNLLMGSLKNHLMADGTIGNLTVTGKLQVTGATSSIAVGATPPTAANAGTGIWLDRTGLYSLNANTYQVKIDATDGKLYAGGGKITLDAAGISLVDTAGIIYYAGDRFLHIIGSSNLENIFFGRRAGNRTMDAQRNIGFGHEALSALTTGSYNTAIGTGALVKLTNSNLNLAVGSSALANCETGGGNTALGTYALYSNVGSYGCVGLGQYAGYYETAGNKLFIDNVQRASEADGRAKALVYGVFAAATADQSLAFNCGTVSVLGTITGTQLISNIATGTKPLDVTSTTVCTNLNADMCDGAHISGSGYTLTVPATGTAALLGTANVFTANQQIKAADVGIASGHIEAWSTDGYAIDKGGTFGFRGQYATGSYMLFGTIQGAKENVTSGDLAGYIRFCTSGAASNPAERVRITSTGKVGIADTNPAEMMDVTGNINATGVYKIDDVQVVSNRVIDARCDDAINSGDATTDGVIDSLRDAMIAHGLIAAA